MSKDVVLRIKHTLDEMLIREDEMDDIEFLFRAMTLQTDLDILAKNKYFWGDVLSRYKFWANNR